MPVENTQSGTCNDIPNAYFFIIITKKSTCKLYISFFICIFVRNIIDMKFELITENERLWAVRYDDCLDNVLDSILGQWNDVAWLRSFFKDNIDDLASYFKITDVNQAIYDTIEDSERLQCLIMDISPDADLDKIFRPLENSRTSEMLLGKEKARLHNAPRHASWLRIYAIKLEPGIYVITGGAIKLTRTMQEREHTLVELARMEKVRRFLLDNGIADKDSFVDYLNELK